MFWTVCTPQTTVSHLQCFPADERVPALATRQQFYTITLLFPWRQRKVSIQGWSVGGEISSPRPITARVQENRRSMTHSGIPLTRVQWRTAALSSWNTHTQTRAPKLYSIKLNLTWGRVCQLNISSLPVCAVTTELYKFTQVSLCCAVESFADKMEKYDFTIYKQEVTAD